MSTSILYYAFQIKGVKYNSTAYEGHALVFRADIADTHFCCPNCKSRDVYSKGQRERRFHLPPMGRKQCFLDLRVHQIFCKACEELHWFHLPFMKGKSRMTRSLKSAEVRIKLKL